MATEPTGRGSLEAATTSAADEALAELEAQEGTGDTPEATGIESPEVPEAPPGEQSEVTEGEPGTESEAPQEGTEDVPTSYFGLDLSGLDAEQRASVIGTLKEQNSTIGKLMRGRAEDEGAEEEPETEAPAPEVTDEAIIQALGLDPDDPYDEKVAKAATPLVRKQLEQDALLATIIENQELQALDTTWRTGLASMEKTYGALPEDITHDRVMELAADEGIGSPQDAYWRIVGPAQAQLREAMNGMSAAQRTAAKKAAASTRPTTTTANEEAPLKATNARDATKEAAAAVLAKLGIT